VAQVVIPANLAATVVAWEGDSGRAWLARVPSIVNELADAWDLDVGPPYEPGGNISWVAPVRRRGDGTDAVLKVQHPHPESAPEPIALAAWDGAGAVHLLAHDAGRCALLLERCEPGSALADEPDPLAAARIGGAVGARLHAMAPPSGLPSLAEVLTPWADQLDGQLQAHPAADPGLARRALATMRQPLDDATRQVLLHGDLNPTNVLAATREPWLAIDPKPMVGDAAYDGPRLVWQPDPLRATDPAALVATRLGIVTERLAVEPPGLAEWCLVAAVEVGVSAAARGDAGTAEQCRAHIALIAPHLA